MEIHQLRYFVAVAEEGSFSNAAEREHVSQPSLSQQIHKLEEELNQQLFDRLPRSVVLTEAGRTLLFYARQILSGIAEARQAVTALEHEVAGKLSVGAIPSIALYVLPRLIGSFQRSYPKVTSSCRGQTTSLQTMEDGTPPPPPPPPPHPPTASGSDEIQTWRVIRSARSRAHAAKEKLGSRQEEHQVDRPCVGDVEALPRTHSPRFGAR